MDVRPATRKELNNSSSDSPPSVYKTNPGWVGISADRYVLDPGIPAVRQWVTNITAEVVQKYDVDGIQFDDYFYYETQGSPLKDDKTFKRFGTHFSSKHDWRRHNTYTLVQEISHKIKAIKPHVRFGISPAASGAIRLTIRLVRQRGRVRPIMMETLLIRVPGERWADRLYRAAGLLVVRPQGCALWPYRQMVGGYS